MYTFMGSRGPGSHPDMGCLGRRVSGCVGGLVHVHGLRGAWFSPGYAVLDEGRQAVLAALYMLTGSGGPGSCPDTGVLGQGASGGVGRLVHVHGLGGAWFSPGYGGSWTRGVRWCWPPCTCSWAPGGLVLARIRGVLDEGGQAVLAALYTLMIPCRVWLVTRRAEYVVTRPLVRVRMPACQPLPLGRETR